MDFCSYELELVKQLRTKLNSYQAQHDKMRAINAYYREHGSVSGFPGIPDKESVELDTRAKAGPFWDTPPYPSYILTEINVKIFRLRAWLNHFEKYHTLGYVGWTFRYGEAVVNNQKGILQLYFQEGYPFYNGRKKLNRCHILWNPLSCAWERRLDDDLFLACDQLDFLRPTNGMWPSLFQPDPKWREVLD